VFDFEGFELLLLLMADWFSEMVDVVEIQGSGMILVCDGNF
jgi:hypothetical protein